MRASEALTCKVIDDIKKEEVNTNNQFEEIGICDCNFDFNNGWRGNCDGNTKRKDQLPQAADATVAR